MFMKLASKPLSESQEALVVSQFSALAQPTRLQIFRELVKVQDCGGESGLTAGALATRLALPAPTLSFHLKELSNASLVTALAMMAPAGPAEKQALLEACDHKSRAELLIAITEIALAGGTEPSSSLQ